MPSPTTDLPVLPSLVHHKGCPVALDPSQRGRVEVYRVPASMRLSRDDGSPQGAWVRVTHCVECGAMAHERES